MPTTVSFASVRMRVPSWGLLTLLSAVALPGGCRCRADAPVAVEEPHFLGWDALVEATWRGDGDRAAVLARDLTGGRVTEDVQGDAAQGITTVGGALGFLGFAEDDAERAEAIAAAARGCGQCHAALSVPEPPRPAWAHETGALWAIDAVVWNRTGEPAPGDPPLDALAGAWTASVAPEPPHTEPETRAARVLVACAACHATDPVRGP